MGSSDERIAKNCIKTFRCKQGWDFPSDVRNALLVVAALTTAVTFQAGVNPPGGVWQDNSEGHRAGTAIYASEQIPFYVFLISNTLALSTSILILLNLYLKSRFPFKFEIFVAVASMIVTYGSAVFAVTPTESVKFRYLLFAAAVPFTIRFVIEIFKKVSRKDKSEKKDHSSGDRGYKFIVQDAEGKQIRVELLFDSDV